MIPSHFTFASATRNVRLWEIEEYLAWDVRSPLIDLRTIKGHLGRTAVSVGSTRAKAWATIGLKKVLFRYIFLRLQHTLMWNNRQEHKLQLYKLTTNYHNYLLVIIGKLSITIKRELRAYGIKKNHDCEKSVTYQKEFFSNAKPHQTLPDLPPCSRPSYSRRPCLDLLYSRLPRRYHLEARQDIS